MKEYKLYIKKENLLECERKLITEEHREGNIKNWGAAPKPPFPGDVFIPTRPYQLDPKAVPTSLCLLCKGRDSGSGQREQ